MAKSAAHANSGLSTREDRGREIARRGGIRQLGDRYIVPSQSARTGATTYLVDLVDETCTCPDFEAHGLRCKHHEAVLFWLAWQGSINEETGPMTVPKKQSTQDWPSYARARTTEREQVPRLLKSLCECIAEPLRPEGTPGRKPIPLREGIVGVVMKVYTMCSGQRAEPDIKLCVERGLLSRAWDSNTLFRVMEDSLTTETLEYLIDLSAAPLAVVENQSGQFALDATGFKTNVRKKRQDANSPPNIERWNDQKRDIAGATHEWVKLHAAVGTLTNVVTAARVTAGTAADSPELRDLLARTAQRFAVREVSADRAYLARENLAAIEAAGALPFIPFKSNSVGMRSPSDEWRRMYCYFALKTDDWLARYHRRSNVESTFGAIKQKFGGGLRSKLFVAQANEVLSKVLLWNLSCVVQTIEEFGIDAEFSRLVLVKS